jgi:exopolysaccharide biosynthesis operon protein EpsL
MHLGAGFSSDLKLSRQHLLLDVALDRAEYDAFSELDHTKANARAGWAWQLGNLWSGELNYRYKREKSSFDELFVRQRDMRTKNSLTLDAGYQIHPDWRLVGALGLSDVEYERRGFLDRDSNDAMLEVQYRNTRNTRVGLRARYRDHDLQNLEDIGGTLIDNDFEEVELSGVFYWEVSGKSALEARFGYLDLDAQRDEQDFDGASGRLIYHGILTGKTSVDVSVWRESSTLYDEITSYVLTKGVSIQPVWSATPKISLQGEIAYTNDDFKGRDDIVVPLGGESRDDDTWLYAVSANWDPRRFLRVSVGYAREERDSSIAIRDYEDDRIEARLRFTF